MLEFVPISSIADLTVGFVGTMATHYESTGVPFLRSLNIKPFAIDEDDIKFISESFNQEIKKSILHTNDVVIVRTGIPGTCCVIPPEYDGCNCSDLVIIRPDTNKVNPAYLAAFINFWGRKQISNNKVGAVQQHFNVHSAEEMLIALPSIEIQHKIAGIINALNSKIDNNNAIAAELEGMAKDLYDYWFVQFDFPDENGKPYKSSGGKMVWNEELKREIPEGWENGIVSDLGTVVTGGTPSTGCAEYFAKSKSGRAWATPKDLSNLNGRYFYHGEADITDAGLKNSAGNIMPKGSVLFTTRAPIGYIAITANEACTNQGFKSIIPAEKFGTEFVFQTLKMLTPQMQRVGVGSTFKEVSKDVFSHQSIVIPSVNLLKKYAALTLDIAEKIRNTQEENVELTSLRDFLLPMLMNGQVKVKGA